MFLILIIWSKTQPLSVVHSVQTLQIRVRYLESYMVYNIWVGYTPYVRKVKWDMCIFEPLAHLWHPNWKVFNSVKSMSYSNEITLNLFKYIFCKLFRFAYWRYSSSSLQNGSYKHKWTLINQSHETCLLFEAIFTPLTIVT